MKQFLINLCYREKGNTSADIQEIQLVAHSIQDAKIAFNLWCFRTRQEKEYTIISAAKVREVKATEPEKHWLRHHPEQVKGQIYVCPYCKETCYASSTGCDYKYCPRCGREV